MKISNKKFIFDKISFKTKDKADIVVELPDKSKYDGKAIFENNNFYFQGKGKMTFADGSIYDGDWKSGKMHGKG